MAHGTHDFVDDPRNERILIWVNGELVPRERAVVSVFDAGFILGDGVCEGLRVRGGHPAFLERHLDRLFEGAKAIVLDVGRSRRELTEAIYSTLRANDMTACIQAYTAGADEALMLDPHGFVATCNSTHFFIVAGLPGALAVLTSD